MFVLFLAVFLTANDDPNVNPTLGIVIEAVDPKVEITPQLPVKYGVWVRSVAPSGAADRAGIKEGDVIAEIDNKKIITIDKFRQWVESAKEDKKRILQVYQLNQDVKQKKWVKKTFRIQMDFAEVPAQTREQPARAPGFYADYLRNEGGVLRVRLDSHRIYLPSDGNKKYYQFLEHSYRENGKGVQNDKAGFYEANGSAEQLKIESSDIKIMEIENNPKLGLGLNFKDSGKVALLFTLGDKKLEVISKPT